MLFEAQENKQENRNVLYRRALEGLRNGVPNQTAALLLGCNQPEVESRFDRALKDVAENEAGMATQQGFLISGGFGVGKSHLLAHLENLAITRNFVCSKVAISKETPLFDLGKVFVAAVERARMPKRSGRFMEELVHAAQTEASAYQQFRHRIERACANGIMSPMLLATLVAHEKSRDQELKARIESFWAGGRMTAATLRAGLKLIGEAGNYRFTVPRVAELATQRLRFAAELVRGAGYAGWVVLLDEIELIGHYSLQQRGRSYAEVTRWMGKVAGEVFPGLIVVGTVSDDFASYVIQPDGIKKDRDYVGPKLRDHPRLNVIAKQAETGMHLLEKTCIPLKDPSEEDVQATMVSLRNIYEKAYDWPAQPLPPLSGGTALERRMRYRIRSAINKWDLDRLKPGAATDVDINPYRPNRYEEDPDLEAVTEPE